MPRTAQADANILFPEPLPWNERDPALGNIEGDRSYFIDNLVALLSFVGDGVTKSEAFSWPTSGKEIAVGTVCRPINSSGLLASDGQAVRLSPHARRWLETQDPGHLIGIIHAHVRFIGEILSEVSKRPLSQVKLHEIACANYGFGWRNKGPIHVRIKWLQAAGAVSVYSHRVNITDKGREVLRSLSVYEPEATTISPADLQPAPRAIETLLSFLESTHEGRSRAAAFSIPNSSRNRGQLDAIRSVVETCASATDQNMLVDKIVSIFETGPTAAEKCVQSLKIAGLIERVSPTEFKATAAGSAWAASTYSIDLARIIHANIWYFGEIVKELESSVQLTFAEVLSRSAKYSSANQSPLSRNGLTARMSLLTALDLIMRTAKSTYRATPLGIAFAGSVSCLTPIAHDAEDQAPLTPLDISQAEEVQRVTNTGDQDVTNAESESQAIADRLVRAARQSEKSVELELATIQALRYLGLPATHIGGNGRPDGTVRTAPGKLGDLLTVEAKCAANGIVPEEQAKQRTLADHREQYNAVGTVYIGPGFERRLLDTLDNDEKVAVVSTAVIAEAVRRQPDTPLTPKELDPLINASIPEGERRGHLLSRWKEKEDWTLAMRAIVEILAREAESPMWDDEPDSAGLGWLDITSIRRSLRDLLSREVSKELILDVLNFLVSPQVALAESSEDRYRLAVASEVVAHHFEYLGRRWLLGNRLYSRRKADRQGWPE
ncbi:hypothetical protein [Micromonospora sp. NPDC004551]|uniref:hypothetical protein n=1 Tax=Micromonospora sp. NPDC004551 TaxID=3154284 RepID=UPI0033A81E01